MTEPNEQIKSAQAYIAGLPDVPGDIPEELKALAADYKRITADYAGMERRLIGAGEALNQTRLDLEANRAQVARLEIENAKLARSAEESAVLVESLKLQLLDAQAVNDKNNRQINEALRLLNAHFNPEKPLTLNQLASSVAALVDEVEKAKVPQ